MKRIKSLVAVVLTAGIIGCQSAPVHTAAAPVPSASVALAAEPSTKSRTMLVVALLAALVVAAVIVSATSGGDDIY